MSEHSCTHRALDDFAERMRQADRELRDQALGTIGDRARARLAHKAEGVRLALSYVEEAIRTEPTDVIRPLRVGGKPIPRHILDGPPGEFARFCGETDPAVLALLDAEANDAD